MGTHTDIDRIRAWIDGTLPEAEAAALRTRLDADPELATFAAAYREVVAATADEGPAPTTALSFEALRLDEVSTLSARRWWARPAAAIAASVLLAAGAGLRLALPDSGIAPVASGPGFASHGGASKAVSVIGIEPETYLRVIGLADKIVAGKPSPGSSDIIIGIQLAKDLGANLGDKLRLSTASGAAETLSVAGIFDFGSRGANQRNVYIALRVAQNLLNLEGGVSSIEIKVQDPFAAEVIAQTVQAETGLQADSWIKTNAQFFSAMAAQTLSNTLIRFFVGLTAALGIASVLVVSVVQKSKEIGILRAMGTSRMQVLRLFLLQGGLMGLSGSLLGSLLGWGFLMLWRGWARNADGTPMFIIVIEPALFVLAAAGATLVGILAAVVPARRAARLDPAVAIRG